MDFNTFLIRFGLNSKNFVNKVVEPITIEGGFLYELEQSKEGAFCPHCGNMHLKIKDYSFVEIKSQQSNDQLEIFRIKKVRFYCPECNKSFTRDLEGISRYQTITDITRKHMLNDFTQCKTFKEIGDTYGLSSARVIQIFDESFPNVPRLPMPEVLCIDEIYFKGDTLTKYVVVLSDFFTGEIVDVIRERQMPYLREYFSKIPLGERKKVKIFISDMYDAYDTICTQYFPNAMHCIDLFHVIKQLTEAVNRQRKRVANLLYSDNKIYKNFMNKHWKLFLCNRNKIPNKFYTPKNQSKRYHYDDMVFECIKLNQDLWDGYSILQELFKYNTYDNYEAAINFIERIANKLDLTCNELYLSVSKTYKKWKYEIGNAFAKNQYHKRFTNAIAENNNTHIKRIIKAAYGYRNFERFRKKILLNRTYK